ncbi:hypothetical protein [Bacteroides sp.]
MHRLGLFCRREQQLLPFRQAFLGLGSGRQRVRLHLWRFDGIQWEKAENHDIAQRRIQVGVVSRLEVAFAQSVEVNQIAFQVVAPVKGGAQVPGGAFACSGEAVDVEGVSAFCKCLQLVFQPVEGLPVLPVVLLEHLDAGGIMEYERAVGGGIRISILPCLCM